MNEKKYLILIVDDDTVNIDILVLLLKEDFNLAIAKNGSKALDYVQKHTPDLILLDINLPGIDGFETYKRIRAKSNYSDTPIIFMTEPYTLDDKLIGKSFFSPNTRISLRMVGQLFFPPQKK